MRMLWAILAFSIPAMAQYHPVFEPLRYNDDFTNIPDTASNWYIRLKHKPLGNQEKSCLSIGGDARVQYQHFHNEKWGDVPPDTDGHLLLRILQHADIKTSRFRMFIQLQASLVEGRINPSPLEKNPLDIHQAFIDIIPAKGKNTCLTIRFGRQEMLLGSQRLVSVREGPNSRLAFDGVCAIVNSKSFQNITLYTHPVANKPGVFNDDINQGAALWGNYASFNAGNTGVDLYYLGLKKQHTVLNNIAGSELRHSSGIRLWKKNEAWMYDAEGLWQWGSIADSSIAAWTVSLNTSYTFGLSGQIVTLGLKTEAISGDRNTNDAYCDTFNPLYPRGAYFGLASLIGPSNLYDLHPYLIINPEKAVSIGFDYDVFWRMSANDGIYTPSLSLIYPGEVSRDRFIGWQAASDITYIPNPFVTLAAEGTWFVPGKFIRQSGKGHNLLFVAFTAQFKF